MQLNEVQTELSAYRLRTAGGDLDLILRCESVLRPTLFARFLLRHLEYDATNASCPTLDLGTGCGVLAIALRKLGWRDVDATDINPAALDATKKNASLNGCQGGLRVLPADLFAGLDRKYGLIVSNPPTFPCLPHRIVENGVERAFFAGQTGREFVDGVVDKVCSYLLPDGKLFLLVPSYHDPTGTLAGLRENGLCGSIRATIEVPTADYAREISTYGLPGQEMIDAALRQILVGKQEDAFKLDLAGRPLLFWLSLIVATRTEHVRESLRQTDTYST